MVDHLHKFHGLRSSFLAYTLLLLVVLYGSKISNSNAINESISAVNQTTNQSGSQINQTNLGTKAGSGSNTAALIMRTDKTVYNPAELVKFVISNTGTKALVFPDSALGLTVKNIETNTTYPVHSVPTLTTLAPNETMVITWAQTSTNNTNAPPGVYTGYIPAESSPISVTFRIISFTSYH